MHRILAASLILSAAFTMNAAAQTTDGADRQVILITGSTDGLGREVALRLAAEGHHVIIHGRNQERGEAVLRQVAEEGKGSAAFYAADLASL